MARVISLQLHGAHGQRLRATSEVRGRVGGGLEGDSHVDREKRGVVVLDRSTNDALGLKPGDLREQITIEGMPDLNSLAVGTRLRIGGITLRVNGPCEPCTHIGEMNAVADPREFQSQLEGRRGLICTVLAAEAPVRVGDDVAVQAAVTTA
ncbi:MAG TPA: MOSC domain-containing protein [Candidatus Saccharimonadales bacterium]|nr:MOSC domain-containing protein [Candidatus Saccharimonadales bacterium]